MPTKCECCGKEPQDKVLKTVVIQTESNRDVRVFCLKCVAAIFSKDLILSDYLRGVFADDKTTTEELPKSGIYPY